jgi:Flp pilus assembly protein TadB
MKLNEIKNLLKNIKELGLKEVIRRTKESIPNIQNSTLIKIELRGYILSIIGTLIAFALILIYQSKLWYIVLAFIFSVIIYVSQYLQKYKIYKQFKELEELQKEIKEE